MCFSVFGPECSQQGRKYWGRVYPGRFSNCKNVYAGILRNKHKEFRTFSSMRPIYADSSRRIGDSHCDDHFRYLRLLWYSQTAPSTLSQTHCYIISVSLFLLFERAARVTANRLIIKSATTTNANARKATVGKTASKTVRAQILPRTPYRTMRFKTEGSIYSNFPPI